ncbi:MAG: NAD-dependent epimerase/dehydratase family protein [Planctomycetota bacterium]
MQILVLGGSGNISSDCVQAWCAAGHEVSVLNRGSQSPPAGVRQFVADRNDATAMAAALGDGRFDAVVDFLCFDPEQAAAAHRICAGRCAQFVFVSSATVYAKPHVIPVAEDHSLGNPASPYAEAKLAAERWFAERHGDGFPLTVVRPSHTFSRRWIPSPFSGCDWTLCARIEAGEPVVVPDDGRTPWALTATEDFARALGGLLGNPAAIGNTFNITTNEAGSWNEFHLRLGAALGRTAVLRHMPAARIAAAHPELGPKLEGDKCNPGVFDNSRLLRAVPGFACRFTLQRALERSVAWFRADPARMVCDPQAAAIHATLAEAAG